MSSDPPTGFGIHDLSLASTRFVLTHAELSRHRGDDVRKYHTGIGQRAMSVPAADEDIVTMAAAAAGPVVERHGAEHIRTLVLATETSVDQSKAAGVYVHSLLGLPPHIRIVELKQACYSATAGLQFATALVHRDPDQQVLVIASDISRYALNSPGEATQGAAAAALLVSADPALIRLEGPSGLSTRDIMDFWRPNYRSTPLVKGKESVTAYLQALEATWQDYRTRGGVPHDELRAICYHQPYSQMAYKAHRHLLDHCTGGADASAVERAVGLTTGYNEMLGNSYTASVYLALAALLEGDDELAGRLIGLFSYGSGSVAEFFAGRIQPGYREHLRTAAHQIAVTRRQSVDYTTYRELRETVVPTDGSHHALPRQTTGPFRLAGIREHERVYEPTGR